MKEFVEEATEELKRVDHLIYVSLKYTRTVDVLKNVLERMISCFDIVVTGILQEAEQENKIFEMPVAPLAKVNELKKLYPDKKELMEYLAFYLKLRVINRAPYDKEQEFRRHVAMTAHTEAGDEVVHIDRVSDFYQIQKEFMEYVKKEFDDIQEED